MTPAPRQRAFALAGLFLASLLLAGLASAQQSNLTLPNAERALGRMHPILIHFPIALLAAAAVFETVSAIRRRGISPAAVGCLAMGAGGAVFAATAGWFNASFEHADSPSSTLTIHRWLGVAAAALSVLGLFCALPALWSRRAGFLAPYRGLVLLSAIVAGGAGHFGGSLTYGPDYWVDPLLDLFGLKDPAKAGSDSDAPRRSDGPGQAEGRAPSNSRKVTIADVKFPDDGVIDFTKHVKPILDASCLACHGPAKRRGGLRVDSLAALLTGGNGGEAVIPGKSAESYLIERVLGQGGEQRMPLDLPALPDDQVRILKAWIDQGAKWDPSTPPPGGAAPTSRTDAKPVAPTEDKEETHWAYVRPADVQAPDVKRADWCRSPVDRFVLAKLTEQGLTPSPEAPRETLIRRVTLDLTGLPPTLAEIDAFVHDDAPDAFEKVVDRLLASPAYGERWARVWLDLARFADSRGYEKDQRWQIWPYRDWVINALNADMPFDQFTIDQLAGDLLPDHTTDQMIATGFSRCSMVNEEGGVDPEEARVVAVMDRTNTTAAVWLGTTLGCAQCHDHKYDPFTQKDYYGFLAFFNSTPVEIRDAGSGDIRPETPQMRLPRPDEPKLRADLDRAEALLASLKEDSPERKKAVESRDAIKRTIEAGFPMEVMKELDTPRETHVFVRGSYLSPGDIVHPDVPKVLGSLDAGAAKRDRLTLARWLVSPDNPLTARVQVNRIWSQHFGRALVETEEDFGTRGSEPSNQPLLDFLATQFVKNGWSFKKLHRLIVTSATYRQGSNISSEALAADPTNTFLARGPRFRLDAEAIRDTALAASGLLSRKMGGPSVFPQQPPGVWRQPYSSDDWVESTGEDKHRRGVYTFIKRASPYPSFVAFDAPARQVTCTRRSRTNTPLAALTTLNDPAFFECAVALGRRAMFDADAGATDAEKLTHVFRLCAARRPSEPELKRLTAFLIQERTRLAADSKAVDTMLGTMDGSLCDGLTTPQAKAELAAWAMVGNVILNLDEALNIS